MAKLQKGDKVRCVQKTKTPIINQNKITVSQIYTVARRSVFFEHAISLQEINDIYPSVTGWLFHEDDFELVNSHQNANDAWDRAMGGV